jgi:hypothetical protein
MTGYDDLTQIARARREAIKTRDMDPARYHGLPVLCAGLYSSGSTWLFNVVARLYEATHLERSLARFYSDDLYSFPEFSSVPDVCVVKTHIPDRSLQILAACCLSPVLVTLREPRDAVASLISRFDFRFESQLSGFAACASRMIDLARSGALVLRYEDRFYDDPATVARIAAFLGLNVRPEEMTAIWQALRPESVKSEIAKLTKERAFGQHVTPVSVDPRTQWHPGHIGDREIGKYRHILSATEQEDTISVTTDYCREFGYTVPALQAGRGSEPT